MFKPIILCFLVVFISNCGKKNPEKSYLPKMEFKKKPNPKYDHYFPNKNGTKIGSKSKSTAKLASKEPIPSFQKTTITNTKKESSQGFFKSLFTKTDDNKNEEQNVCKELLDINKDILIDQNNKLVALNKDNLNLKKQLADLDSQINRLETTKSNSSRSLEKEIDRLNKLIKILSTEIK
tara:strand:+ start:313 stop:849 length:537 start_codon:yes stop_codon:yes gene_type:complete